MNISSEIFTSDGSNSSDHFFFNDTRPEIGFEPMVTVYIITVLLGVPTNSYVIWLIVTGTGNGLAAELFSLNLAVCEILLCLNYLFTVFTNSFIILILLIFSGQGLASTGRPLFQCLICVERYLAVVHPVTFLKFKPLRYRVICTVFVCTSIFASCWVLILLMCFSLIGLVFVFIVAQLILYLSIQMFCCLAVLRALKQSGPGERVRGREEENHMKRRAFNVILIITGTMIIIYAPNIISVLLFMSSVRNSDIVLTISRTSFSLGGLVQPLLFLHRLGKLPFTKCKWS